MRAAGEEAGAGAGLTAAGARAASAINDREIGCCRPPKLSPGRERQEAQKECALQFPFRSLKFFKKSRSQLTFCSYKASWPPSSSLHQ